MVALSDTESIIQEKLKGRLHWDSVIFAIKEKYEKQIIRENITINFNHIEVNEIFAIVETQNTISSIQYNYKIENYRFTFIHTKTIPTIIMTIPIMR